MKINKIFKIYNSNMNNKFRLIIFPYAGGSASVYKDWAKHLSPEIEILSVQLPGREERSNETPYYFVEDVMRELSDCFVEMTQLPFAFYGHSMGALFCYEIARYLEKNDFELPSHIFLSGSNPPNKRVTEKRSNFLSDDELIQILKDFNGIPPEILNNKELLNRFLPIIQADLAIVNNYEFRDDYKFSMPLTVFGGESDSVISVENVKEWKNFTTGYCRVMVLPGGHFFIFSEIENLLAEINRELRYQIASNYDYTEK